MKVHFHSPSILWAMGKRSSHALLCVMVLLSGTTSAYESKWDRIKPLASGLLSGEAPSRLEKEKKIFEIMDAQEESYPIIYVDQNATGSNNGSSWKNAYTSLQKGIDKAALSEGWVWVAQGTYTDNYIENDTLVAAFKVKSGVMLFGGFQGCETQLNQRNPTKYVTVLHGSAGQNGPRAVDIEHLAAIDGFLIRDSGYKDYPDGTAAHAIAGGGIRTHGWLAIIRNNRITGCYAKGGAGVAVWVDEEYLGEKNYAPIIDNNVIYRNIGKCGAGVQLRNDETLFTHNIVAYNSHPERAKGIEVIINNEFGDPCYIINNIVWNNSTEYWGSTTGMNFNDLYNHVRSDADARCLYNCISEINADEHSAGLLMENPGFVDPENNDYSLEDDSPCINAGHPDGPKDIDGSRADIGLRLSLYLLTIDNGNVPGNHSLGGYYSPYEEVTITAESPIVMNDTTRYIFKQWKGEGEGSYTGSSITATVTMYEDITETIIWKNQYHLNVESNSTTADEKSGWYDENSSVVLSVPELLSESDSVRYRFLSWTIEGNAQSSSSSRNLTLQISGPTNVYANWQTEYRVTVTSDFSSTYGSGWYAKGSSATVKADSLIQQTSSHRHRFSHWTSSIGDLSDSCSTSITVEAPTIIKAIYQEQFMLTIESAYGTSTGQGWHDANKTISFGIDSLANVDATTRYRFLKWTSSTNQGYQGSLANATLTINEAITQTATWQKEFYVSIQITPENSGIVSPLTTPGGWASENAMLTLQATGNSALGYGFKSWSGDVNSTNSTLMFKVTSARSVIAQFAMGDITVTSVPPGLTIIADNIEYTTPQIFYWRQGETHQISAIETQDTLQNIRYSYSHWGHEQSLQNTITIPQGKATYTAYFDTSYYMAIESQFGEPEGEGWYSKGTTASVFIDTLAYSDTTGVRYHLSDWLVDNVSTNGKNANLSVLMNAPKTAQTKWQKEYQVDAKISPEYGGIIYLIPTGNWYVPGSTVTLSTAPVDTHFTFVNWEGSLTGSIDTQVLTMNSPKQVIARYTTSTIFPPEIRHFSDVTVLEDSVICYTRQEVLSHISDANDPVDSLSYRINEEAPFTLESSDLYPIRLRPDPDWNGKTQIILFVTDPYGLTVSDTIDVTVFPVSDAPKPFSLVSPENGAVQDDSQTHLRFVWSQSLNVDVSDTITYMFNISPDSTFLNSHTITITALKDTFVIVSASQINGEVYWGVSAIDKQGMTTWCTEKFLLTIQSAVENQEPVVPKQFTLAQNYPNPFNGYTQIEYDLPSSGNVRIEIFDIQGQHVCELLDQRQNAGHYAMTWTATDHRGNSLASGLYFVQIEFDRQRLIRKMSYVR